MSKAVIYVKETRKHTQERTMGLARPRKWASNKMVLTKTISSVSRQHKRDRSLVAYSRSNKICTRCHSSLFSLSAYKLCTPLYRWTHTLFFYFFFFFSFFSMLRSFIFLYVTLFLLLCIFLTELASELCSTQRTHTPSHGRDTCAMLRNTRKATLNGIGTQRKKDLATRWGKLYLLMLGGVKHELAMMVRWCRWWWRSCAGIRGANGVVAVLM